MRTDFVEYFNSHTSKPIVLNGGQGTELERRGVKVNNALWSTVPFLKARDAKFREEAESNLRIVTNLYKDYISSGAQILSSITYQCSFCTIKENTDITSIEDYKQLLNFIVKFCRDSIGEDSYLLGSIGPYAARIGAEYHGNYGPSPDSIDYLKYFKPQLDAFNANETIDLIGFETIPNKYELAAILSWNESVISKPFYVSLSLDDNGSLRDGTTMEEIGALFQNGAKNSNMILAGANCVRYNSSVKIIELLHQQLPGMPLIVYPNSGETYDPTKKVWNDNIDKDMSWEDLVKLYWSAGARVIGGCCRTTPNDTKCMKKIIDCF